MGRRLLAMLAFLVLGCASAPQHVRRVTQAPPSTIVGFVYDRRDDSPIEGALVIVQSAALFQSLEHRTGADGLFEFTALPAGTYTVQVLAGVADLSKIGHVSSETGLVAELGVDPTYHRPGCPIPRARDPDESLMSTDKIKRRY